MTSAGRSEGSHERFADEVITKGMKQRLSRCFCCGWWLTALTRESLKSLIGLAELSAWSCAEPLTLLRLCLHSPPSPLTIFCRVNNSSTVVPPALEATPQCNTLFSHSSETFLKWAAKIIQSKVKVQSGVHLRFLAIVLHRTDCPSFFCSGRRRAEFRRHPRRRVV